MALVAVAMAAVIREHGRHSWHDSKQPSHADSTPSAV